jgi:repressor LexA
MYKALTKRQKEILDYIKTYKDTHGFAPSLEEIGKYFKLKAVSTVHEHIDNLKRKGYIKKEMNQARGIELVDPTLLDGNFIEIQKLGTITAGEPIEALEDPEPILVNKDLLGNSGRYYALDVRGTSMIEEGIFDGDTVIIKEQSYADNGDTVVAIVQDNMATLKKYYKEKNRIRLQPANEKLKPTFFRNVQVRGKLISLIRKFD